MKTCIPLFTLLFCSAFLAAQEGNGWSEWLAGHPGKVLVCGHRGGFEGALPENSLSRFKKTASKFKKSAVMLELDVRQSADGELYVLHDDTLERTTTGKGLIKNTQGQRRSSVSDLLAQVRHDPSFYLQVKLLMTCKFCCNMA